ncbi:MAG: hypothetical protein ACI8ZM_003906 [Crocinitomix sp.]|jgi:hypothetical protein
MKQKLRQFSLITSLLFIFGCQKPTTPASININNVEFEQTNEYIYLDLPDGTYMPDNPDFNINNSATWTGNMAQYVKHNRFYDVNFQISNSGGSVAYDTEIDLYYIYDTGEEVVESKVIGNLSAGGSHSNSVSFIVTNKKMIECFGEVYWYN